jgi:hypothetical protein
LRQSDRESCGGGGDDLDDAKRGWRIERLADERRREVEREVTEDENEEEEEERREKEENREEIIGDIQGLVELQLRACECDQG